MKKSKILALLCAAALVAGSFTACGDGKESDNSAGKDSSAVSTSTADVSMTGEKNSFEKKIEFTAAAFGVTEGTNYMEDEMFKVFSEKFNFTYKLIPLSWENWADKNRIWITSGDMPDILFWDFKYKEYESYAKSGMIKALPADYETKYPNLAKSISRVGIADYLKNKMDGKLYFVPKAIYLTPITEKPIDAQVVVYRKDWAEKVGRQVDKLISLQELTSLAKDFMEKDPGNNGAGKTIGISSSSGHLSWNFVKPFNSYYSNYHKVDGKYIWGAMEPETLEGVRAFSAYYNENIIDKDFYTYKGTEYRDKFNAGKVGIFIDGASADNLNGYKQTFAKANPGIDVEKAIGICQVLGPDGKYHGNVTTNFWASSIFSPKMDDEKLDRILCIFDYITTPEGQRLVNAGIEGKDYTLEGNSMTVTRAKNDDGSFKHITEVYPSANFFYNLPVLPDDWSANDPSLPETTRNQVKEMFQEKEKNGNFAEPDYDLSLFSAPNFDKANIKVDDGITEVILKKGDVTANWNDWLKSVEPKVRAALNELNEAYGK